MTIKTMTIQTAISILGYKLTKVFFFPSGNLATAMTIKIVEIPEPTAASVKATSTASKFT